MLNFTLHPYTPQWANRWDSFVLEGSQNGTFLQSRRFLSYHPEGRFEDASLLMAAENGTLMAVVPAARQRVEGEWHFRSHPGSTFGGLVLAREITQADEVMQLVDALDAHLQPSYRACELKITPQLFACRPTATLEYALFNRGYRQDTEIAAYLPLSGVILEDLRSRYSPTKRYELKRCQSQELTARLLTTEDELASFYGILLLTLRKFDATPVHTLEELRDFWRTRLTEEVRFLGVFNREGQMVGGACLFYFSQTRTLHTQYLATQPGVRGYSPSVFLYDSVIRAGIDLRADQVSFGTSTYEHGHVLNAGLMQNKESYGCLHTLNRLFTRRYA